MKAVGQDTPAEKKRASLRSEEKSALASFLEGRSNSGGANHNVFLMLKQFNGRDAAPQASEGLSRLEYAFDNFVGRACLIFPFSFESALAQLRRFYGGAGFLLLISQNCCLFRGQRLCLLSLRKTKKKSSKATGFGRINH